MERRCYWPHKVIVKIKWYNSCNIPSILNKYIIILIIIITITIMVVLLLRLAISVSSHILNSYSLFLWCLKLTVGTGFYQTLTSINTLEKGVRRKKTHTDILPQVQGSLEITHLLCSCIIIIIDSFTSKANFIIAWGFDRLFGQTLL